MLWEAGQAMRTQKKTVLGVKLRGEIRGRTMRGQEGGPWGSGPLRFEGTEQSETDLMPFEASGLRI